MRQRYDAPPLLQEVCLEVVSECPLDCMHCSSYAPAEKGRSLGLATIRRLLDEVAAFGTPIIEFSGGEPLCHSRILQMVEHASDVGLVPCVYTSGIYPSNGDLKPVPRPLIGRLVEAGLKRVVLSIHGAGPTVHEHINRTPGTFEKTVESIRRLKEQELWVGAHFVPMKPNWKEAEAIAELCARLQVNELAILRFVPQGRGEIYQHRLRLNGRDYCRLLRTLRALRSSYSDILRVRIGSPLNFCSFYPRSAEHDALPTPCQAGIATCTVLPTGSVVPCPAFKHQADWVGGNILEESFAKIWKESHVFSKLRSFDHHLLSGQCSECEFLEVCRGRCHAQRVIAWGDLLRGPDPRCPYVSCGSEKKCEQDVQLEAIPV